MKDPKNYLNDPSTLAAIYQLLSTERDAYLRRARTCSALTLPALYPPEGHSGTTPLRSPYQSLGARGVNVMASKLMLTTLPPNRPFVKLELDDATREELGAKVGEADQALQRYVKVVAKDVESTNTRPTVVETMKHLLVAGNVLLYDNPEKGLRLYTLKQFCIKRRPDGAPLKAVVHQLITREDVPESIKEEVERTDDFNRSPNKDVNLHTGIFWRASGKVEVYQEINGIEVPGSRATHNAKDTPWIPLRMIPVDGEDYGRSYVEDHIGDLKSFELLSRSVVHGAAAAAKIIFLTNPNGQIRPRQLASALGGDVLEGTENDVSTVKLDKGQDFNFALTAMERLERSLSLAFLLNTAIQRNGERVTAEEIRYMAQELESQLGGAYSALSKDFQQPLYHSRVRKLNSRGKLPQLPEKATQVQVTAGLDAIGRGNDFEDLRLFFQTVREAFGDEAAKELLDRREGSDRLANALGINTQDLVKTADQIAQDRDEEQQRMMQQAAVSPTINQVGRLASQGPTQ